MRPSFFAHLPHLGPSGGDFKASRRNCMQHSHITLVTAKCFQVDNDNCAEAWLWYLICLWSAGKGSGRTGLQLNIVSDVFMFNDYPSVYAIAK